MRLRFGDLVLDEGRRLVRRGAEGVSLSPRAFQLLSLLLARRPRAVPRAELAEALWPGAGSGGVGLPPVVDELHERLGPDPRGGSWVRAVRAFGYAFDGEARELPAAPCHALVRGRRRIDLAEGRNVLGREPKATIRLGHPSVAHEHARIVVADDRAQLEDLTGIDATFRGTEPVHGPVLLADGDLIRVGSVVLTYRILAA